MTFLICEEPDVLEHKPMPITKNKNYTKITGSAKTKAFQKKFNSKSSAPILQKPNRKFESIKSRIIF